MGEAINRVRANERRKRVVGLNARCRICHIPHPAALQRDRKGIICYECAAVAAGRSIVERHHPFGRAEHPQTTIGAPGNMHRLLEAMKAARLPQKGESHV